MTTAATRCVAYVLALMVFQTAGFRMSSAQPCTTGSTIEHEKPMKTCTCSGNLLADTVNTYIMKEACSFITLTDCTIDRMIQLVEAPGVQLEAHYKLINCVMNYWQADYQNQNLKSTDDFPATINYLEFKNVTMLNYSGWNSWTQDFEVDGRLKEMLRIDNSLQLVLNSNKLFMRKIDKNYELALSFANMDLSNSAVFEGVKRMLTRFYYGADVEDEKKLYLFALSIESAKLQSIPLLNLSVGAWQSPKSALSFRSNLIRQVNADSFATYNVSGLYTLNLSDNRIEKFDSKALIPFSKLRELDLSSNRLTSLDLTGLQSGPVSYLNFSTNNLSHLDWPSGLKFSNDTTNAEIRYAFDLSNNPWNCTCALSPLISMYLAVAPKLAAIGVRQKTPVCIDGRDFKTASEAGLCQSTAGKFTTQQPAAVTYRPAQESLSSAGALAADRSNGSVMVIVVVIVSIAVAAAVIGIVVVVVRRKQQQQQQEKLKARVDTNEPLIGRGVKLMGNEKVVIQVDSH